MERRRFLCLSAACFIGLPVAAQASPFVVGVAPHTSARVILEMYQPLRRTLETALGQTVEIRTAPDFNEFARRGLAQEYDLAITTGHQARLLQSDADYLPLLTYRADFRAVALVDRKSAIRSASDLRGKTVLGLSPTSLVTLWGEHWLKQEKVGDVGMRYISAADSVSRQVLAGEASAAFTSLANYQKLPPEQREQLRILAESEPMLGRVYLLNKRHADEQAKISQSLWNFAASPEGQNYFAQNKLEGYRRIRPQELEAMTPFAAETRQHLNRK